MTTHDWVPYTGMLPAVLTGLGAAPTQFAGNWWARIEDGSIMRYQPTGVGAIARFGRGISIGMGALSDDAVQAAAGALMTELSSSGCQQGYDATVAAFQTAFVAAGGTLPNDSNGGSGVDGLYGANTQAALQAVMNAGPNQPPQQAPAGCVSAAAGGGTSQSAADITNNNSDSWFGLPSWMVWVLGGAVVLGGGLIAWSLMSKPGSKHLRAHAHKHHAHAREHLSSARKAHAAAERAAAEERGGAVKESRRRRRSRRSRRARR